MATSIEPGGIHDRDLDLPAPTPSGRRRRSRRPYDPIHRYQRLVANPFLAVFGVFGWLKVMDWAKETYRIEIVLFVLFLLPCVAFLLEYHCLDCGATGRLWQTRSHRCARVEHRRLRGAARWLRGPSPVAQTILWVIGLLVVLFSYMSAIR